MWSTSPTGGQLSDAHLDVLARALPHDPPFAWSVQRGERPMLTIVRYDDGQIRDIVELPASALAPPDDTSLDRYEAFVRALARAYADHREDTMTARLLWAEALVTEDDFHRAIVDRAFRASAVYPAWAARIAADAGLAPPTAAVAQVVGAFADAWVHRRPAFDALRVASNDGVSGRYLVGLAEELAQWRVDQGRPAHTDDEGEDLDQRLITEARPLLRLARGTEMDARIDRIDALWSAMND